MWAPSLPWRPGIGSPVKTRSRLIEATTIAARILSFLKEPIWCRVSVRNVHGLPRLQQKLSFEDEHTFCQLQVVAGLCLPGLNVLWGFLLCALGRRRVVSRASLFWECPKCCWIGRRGSAILTNVMASQLRSTVEYHIHLLVAGFRYIYLLY